jgi:hypothetical protein
MLQLRERGEDSYKVSLRIVSTLQKKRMVNGAGRPEKAFQLRLRHPSRERLR